MRCTQWFDDVSGQMAVEMAVVMPVVLVVALIIYNLGSYIELCAEFDRVSLDAIISQGVSPAGEQTQRASTAAVQDCISNAMSEAKRCSFDVYTEGVYEGSSQSRFIVSPLLTRYHCVMSYKPWPSSFVLAGVPFEAPLALKHERTLVIDRYKSGVVM